MTPEQIKELTTLVADMRHVTTAVDSFGKKMDLLATKADLDEFITKTEHKYQQEALAKRVDLLEKTVDSQAPMTLVQRWTQILAAVAVTATVVGFAVKFIKP